MKNLFADRPIPNLMRGREIGSNLALSADVCVVGSGPGGAIAAAHLAASGARVILLEEGGSFTRKADFHMQEAEAYPKLYQDHGNRATDDLSITILQGRGVGGGTLVNWTTCFRTPEATLALWRERHGLADFTAERFGPHWDEVESRLSIRQVDVSEVNENNAVLLEGAKKLGIATEFLRRNVMSCLHTGYCGMGCPTNAKRGMALTYLPDAAGKGARVYADCRAVRLVLDARRERVTAVEAEVLDPATDRPTGRRVTVSAARFVVAGGAINSPALLLRSGAAGSARARREADVPPSRGRDRRALRPAHRPVLRRAAVRRVARVHRPAGEDRLLPRGAAAASDARIARAAGLRRGAPRRDEAPLEDERRHRAPARRLPCGRRGRDGVPPRRREAPVDPLPARGDARGGDARGHEGLGAHPARRGSARGENAAQGSRRDRAGSATSVSSTSGPSARTSSASSRRTRWAAAPRGRIRGFPSWTGTCATTISRTSGSSTDPSSRRHSESIPSSRSSASSRRRPSG